MPRNRPKLPAAALPPVLVWFRQDLRLRDNPALGAAIERRSAVIPVFIWAPEEEGDWPPGGASKWWLHHSLAAFEEELVRRGSALIIRRGPSMDALRQLLRLTGAKSVFWNRRYEPAARYRDASIKETLRGGGYECESFNAALLHEPWTIENQAGKPFQVFTPFWRHCLTQAGPREPAPAPKILAAPESWPKSIPLAELDLLPKPDWATGLRHSWVPGERGAQQQLRAFLSNAAAEYSEARDFPAIQGTSRLSPHLHFGEISPRQVWHGLVRTLKGQKHGRTAQLNPLHQSRFLTELGWREFSHHLLYHFPETPTQPLRAKFARFPWRTAPDYVHAWQKGLTGYPIVDAGMRELWATGWMHNRVRMIVASFLVKDLLISWTEGARWFWDTLVDADLAQNTLGWQWAAGCGADAAPFFRIFNPTTQGQKFDPNGQYIRRWLPELAGIPNDRIHQPHARRGPTLLTEGEPAGSYPEPIISHVIAREIALEKFAKL